MNKKIAALLLVFPLLMGAGIADSTKIDFDALESAIYRGKLGDETVKELDKFKVVKETQALVIKRR